MRVDYYFTTTVVSKHQWQELFSVCPYFFVINKFTTYTKYWDDRSGPTEQFLKCGGRWPPLLHLGGGGGWTLTISKYILQYYSYKQQMYLLHWQGKICLFSLWGCLDLSDYWTFLEPLTRIFLLLRLMAHAGFTSRGLQIMIFRGSCYSFILSKMSSKHVVSQPLYHNFKFPVWLLMHQRSHHQRL